MISVKDRISLLTGQNRVTGIDFIYVYPDQVTLDIYFLASQALTPALPGSLKPESIEIYSPETGLPRIPVAQIISWVKINDQDVLRLKTTHPGEFSLYRFKIDDPRLDPFYNDITFSFKANCPSELDCKAPDHECAPDEWIDFPVDYQARDFWSYRKALLDFASLRYPDWNDRLEADAGMMMIEVMSALGDDMSYYQDRVSREAYLETATQRRSVRRHARLIDYHMHDGLGAVAWLDVTVKPGNDGVLIPQIVTGTRVAALSNTGSPVDFEVGHGLADKIHGKLSYGVDANRNEFFPHQWDEDQVCLPAGTTELYLEGHHAVKLSFDDIIKDEKTGVDSLGKWILLKTNPTDPDQQARAQLVRLIKISDTTDPVINVKITYIQWEQEQALAHEFDLTILTIRGNMVPATAGRTQLCCFMVDKDASLLKQAELDSLESLSPGLTIEREGHDETLSHLFTLPGSQNLPLVYLGRDTDTAKPEITLQEFTFDGVHWNPGLLWDYRESLLGVNSSKPEDNHFTLDDGTWQRIVGYQRMGEEFEHRDYAFNNGITVRFGDGEFGRIPDKNTLFLVTYRLGGSRRSNVAADTLMNFFPKLPYDFIDMDMNRLQSALQILPPASSLRFMDSVTNPLSASKGLDAETPTSLRQSAPQAFRALTYRAVRPEDYAEAAERLPWIQKAGAAFRYTGGWLTAFVTPDPKGKVVVEDTERTELLNQLNRFRQAGREVYVMDPEYANIDLNIHLCIASGAYAGEVKERVLSALIGKNGIRPRPGYFSPDRFTFGTFLERSSLEAAIQAVPGVKAVEQIDFRRRGWFTWQPFTELSYDPGKHVIIRIENTPLHPDRGTIKLYTHGGL